jgi:nitrogen fixation protein NifQ
MIAAQHGKDIDGAATVQSGARGAVGDMHDGVMVYRLLCGCDPRQAITNDNADFDRHVLASILAVAATEPGGIAANAGLGPAELARLMSQWFPAASAIVAGWCRDAVAVEDDEAVMVRDMLLMQRSTTGDVGRWLAAMVARRVIEPNHLWEDLGLCDRSELSRLLSRHFAPLAVRNTGNMRWKRFFYRMLCEQDGFVMCSTPVCSDCNDFNVCFGDESGESRMAARRREVSLQQVPLRSAPASVSAQSFPVE